MEDCKCEKKCFEKVPQSVRETLYVGYQKLLNNNEKNLYLYGLMYKTSEKGDNPNSRASYSYYVKVNGFQVNVCKKAFISMHGVTLGKIRTLKDKLNMGVIYPNDERGKPRRKMSTNESVTKKVTNHICATLADNAVLDAIKGGSKISAIKMWREYMKQYKQTLRLGSTEDTSTNDVPSSSTKISKLEYIKVFVKIFPRLLEKYHSTGIISNHEKPNESQAVALESTDCENDVGVRLTSVEPDKNVFITKQSKIVPDLLQNNSRNVIHVLEKKTKPGTSQIENILTEYYI